jgi:hypothetical protein
MDLHAHFWTVAPRFRHALLPLAPPPSRRWETWVEDPLTGRVRLTGRLAEGEGGDGRGDLVVVVHGLGGSCDSHAAVRAAQAARSAGLATLRVNLRGSDREGDDFCHAALTSDLHAALASPELARYRRLYLLGWSLGGHIVLRLATEAADPRLAAVAAVCAPLDLAGSVDAIDRPALWAYRRSILKGLNQIYAACAARRPGLLPAREAARIARLRDWDDQVVAPRHGFAGAADYYARASVGPLLPRLRRPALLVAAERDPMVPAATLRPSLAGLQRGLPLEVRWLRDGGHCGFPNNIQVGLNDGVAAGGGADSPERGLERQVIEWLRRQASRGRGGRAAPPAAAGTAP